MIGVEPEGLWVCAVLAGMTKTPFYYHSLELFELREGANRRDRLRKRMERWANRKAAFTIVQDEARAAVLGRTNGISADRIRLVPVSEPGPCRTESSDVLRVRLGIPADRHIALVLGGIYSLNMSLEIAAQTEAPDWPLPWVLVFHGFTSNRDYLKQICHVGRNGRVYVSVNRVPFEEMDTLTASARVGIALYRPVDDNFRLSVFSSGKIALYFKCGLPVIVNDFPVTRPVIERYHCGVCLSDVAQLPDAIRRIEARYEEMRQGAARIFAEKYDFDRFYGPVADEIVVRSGTGGAG
jgi:glycosyltransferase involved in cell wall biosynthesis